MNETARHFFPKQLAKVEKNRSDALSRPLKSEEIASLLSMHFGGEPLYASIDDFYSEEYRAALQSGAAPAELEKLQRYRNATEKEVNMLYCDVHAREQTFEYTGSQADS